MDTFEFTPRKQIRNKPIALEVDRQRHRDMWHWVALGLPVAAILLFTVWQQLELVNCGRRVEQMQAARAAEEETTRRLILEIETLRAPARIEQLASGLDLRRPTSADQIVLERVIAPDPPPSSIVAAR